MSCMPTSARLIELKNRVERLRREAESTVSNIRCFVSRGCSVVAFQESIQDVEHFLRTYPSAGAELDLLVNNLVKYNCELEIALARRSDVSDAAIGYVNNDAVIFDEPLDRQTLSCCSTCSKEKSTVSVSTEIVTVNTLNEYQVEDINRLYDLEKESILEMRHLLGENPSEFWLGYFCDKKLQSHLTEIKQRTNSGELCHLAEFPKIGQFIIGCAGSAFRGSVLSVNNGKIVTVDIDTGELRLVNLHDSWEMGDCLSRLPPQALLCKLNSIAGNVEWCKFLSNIFKNCLSRCCLVVTVKDIIPGLIPIFVVDVDAHDTIILNFNVNQWVNKYVIPVVEEVKLHEVSVDIEENLFQKLDPYVIYKEDSMESNSEVCSVSESQDEDAEEKTCGENKADFLTTEECTVAATVDVEASPSESASELVFNGTCDRMEDTSGNFMNESNFINVVNSKENLKGNTSNGYNGENKEDYVTIEECTVAASIDVEESPSESASELLFSGTCDRMQDTSMNFMNGSNFINVVNSKENLKGNTYNVCTPEDFRVSASPVQFSDDIEVKSQWSEPVLESACIKCSVDIGSTFEMSFLKGNDPWNFTLHYISKEEYDILKKDINEKIQKGLIKSFQHVPKIGNFAIAKCGLEYCRVCVSDVFHNAEEIVATDVDSGEKHLLLLKDLWELDDTFSFLPAMVVNCSLWNITRNPFYWNDALQNLFTKVMSEGPVRVHIKEVESIPGNWKHVVQIHTLHNHIFDVSEWIMLYVFPNVRKIQQLSGSEKSMSDTISKLDPDKVYSEKSNVCIPSPQYANDGKTSIREIENEVFSGATDIPSTSKLQSNPGIKNFGNNQILGKNKNCFERAYENYRSKETFLQLCNKVPRNYFIDFKECSLDVTPGTKYFAFLSSILSPSEFYVHIVADGNVVIDEMHKELKKYCSVESIHFRSKKEAKQLILNCCAVFYENDWYRGRIIDWLDESSDDIFIFVVDFGIYIAVPFQSVQCLRSDFYKYPPFAQRCSLACITPPNGDSVWPTRSLEGFWRILDYETVYEIYIEKYLESDKTLSVFLSCGEGKNTECINDLLIDAQFAVQSTNLIVNKPEYCHSIVYPVVDIAENLSDDEDWNDVPNNTKTLEIVPYFDNNTAGLPGVGDQLPIIITEIVNFGSFYGVPAESEYCGKYCRTHDTLADISKKITFAVETRQLQPAKNLFAGSIVVARFSKDQIWYRARLLTPVDDNGYVDVFFVDYGNIDRVHKTHVKEIRKDFCVLPFQAMRFFIEGIDISKLRHEYAQKKALTILNELSGRGVVIVKVIRVINEDITVRVFSNGMDIVIDMLNLYHEQIKESDSSFQQN